MPLEMNRGLAGRNSSSRIPSVAAKGQRRQLGVSQMVLDTDIYTAEPSDKALEQTCVYCVLCASGDSQMQQLFYGATAQGHTNIGHVTSTFPQRRSR